MQSVRKMTDAELTYTIGDLREVIAIWEQAARDGTGNNPKLGQYWDELHECVAERHRRKSALVACKE